MPKPFMIQGKTASYGFALLLTGLVAIPFLARAHDAEPTAAQPEGWKYPYECCSGYDCRRVPNGWIEETNGGYRIRTTGEVIPYNSSKIKASKDAEFHWCSKGGSDTGKTICLFVPLFF